MRRPTPPPRQTAPPQQSATPVATPVLQSRPIRRGPLERLRGKSFGQLVTLGTIAGGLAGVALAIAFTLVLTATAASQSKAELFARGQIPPDPGRYAAQVFAEGLIYMTPGAAIVGGLLGAAAGAAYATLRSES